MKSTDKYAAAVTRCTPAANPTAIARNTNTVSRASLRFVRNRTAATTPARLNASARLFCTTSTMPATTIGSTISACTSDWL